MKMGNIVRNNENTDIEREERGSGQMGRKKKKQQKLNFQNYKPI